MRLRGQTALPLAVLALALAVRVADPAVVEEARMSVFDTYQRLSPRTYQQIPVRIVDIDDDSLARLGQWPWPRLRIAELLERLHQAGAAAVAFDMVFAEPDRTSPGRVMQLWPPSKGLETLRPYIESLPDHDQVLAHAVGGTNVVLGFGLTTTENQARPHVGAPVAFAGDDPRGFIPSFGGAVVNLPDIAAAAAGSGSLNVLPEPDGVLRRVPLLAGLDGEIYASLAVEALRVAQGAGSVVVKSAGASGETGFGRSTGINHVKIGQAVVETDPNGQVWNYDSGTQPARFVPAWRVLDDDRTAADLAGHIVIIGTSALGLHDTWATPLTPNAPGVEMHAQIIEQMITGDFLRRPDWAMGLEIAYLAALGLALVLLLPRRGAFWCAGLALGAIAVTLTGSWAAFDRLRWLFDPIFPAAAILAIYLIASLLVLLRTEAERRHIRNAFGHFLAPSIVDRLVMEGRMPEQGGEEREMTVWISDLANYSTLSEKLDPPEVVRFLNTVYTVMCDTVEEHGGFVAQFVGDAVVAAFGAPLDDTDHAQHAVEAAMDCRDRVAALGREMTLPPGMELAIRIGISTGPLVVGNIGSKRRLSYTIVGDDINLSSRLEGVNKVYGTTILVNEATVRQCGDGLMFREVDVVQVKGRDAPVRIFEPLGREDEVPQGAAKAAAAFADNLKLFRQRRFAAARAGFQAMAATDPVAAWFAARARDLEADPPPEAWTGTNVMLSK